MNGFHLSGHGGTHDGIIGACAGVGLTISGWSGRFIELKGLSDVPQMVQVSELEARGIRVLSIDRNALVVWSDNLVDTRGWLRPRLWAGGAVLLVEGFGPGAWRSICAKTQSNRPMKSFSGNKEEWFLCELWFTDLGPIVDTC